SVCALLPPDTYPLSLHDALPILEGTVLNLARLNIWSSRRRPGSRQGKGAPLRADASTPAPQTPPSVRAEATSSSDTWVSGSAPQPQLRMYLRIHCPKAIGTE